MGKIFFYIKLAIGLGIGFPIVLLILFGVWLQDKWHKLNCKKCRK
jgi:hypothetical protein